MKKKYYAHTKKKKAAIPKRAFKFLYDKKKMFSNNVSTIYEKNLKFLKHYVKLRPKIRFFFFYYFEIIFEVRAEVMFSTSRFRTTFLHHF
jgi:hypothetical protein